MHIVSENLRGIVASHAICDPTLIEEFSLGIRLGNRVRRMRRKPAETPLTYGVPYDVSDYFAAEEVIPRDLLLAPGESALACSKHDYIMPAGYIGFIQTKGSLARLFVATTCNDGQVEPGFSGRITLELTNHATFPVLLPVDAAVAQLFLFRCSSDVTNPYAGRYGGAKGPTTAVFG